MSNQGHYTLSMPISVDMSVWVSRHRTMSCDIYKPTS